MEHIFGFAVPNQPLLLFAVVLFVLAAIHVKQVRSRRLALLGLPAHGAKIGPIVQSIVFALIALALLRPFFGMEQQEVTSMGRDLVALVDVSKSMLTRDVSPSRLTLAKRKLLDLVTELEGQKLGDRLGIVLFAGQSYLFCPLTSDYGVLDTFINAISTDLISAPGTDLAAAVETATNSLRAVRAQSGVILLLSDGEDLHFERDRIETYLTPGDIRMYVFGIGTPEGKPIELTDGRFLRDAADNIVISRLNETSLKTIAELGAGLYQRIELGNKDLDRMFASMPRQGTQATSGKVTQYGELGPAVLVAVLLGVLVLSLVGKLRLAFPLLLAAILLPNAAHSEDRTPAAASSLREAYEAYQRGDYEAALPGFKAGPKDDPDVQQALASTLYKLDQPEQARQIFEELAATTRDGRRSFESLYNLGNSFLMLKDYRKAIDAYTRSLEVKPGDEQAGANLSLAQELLRQELLRPTPTPPPPSADDNKPQSASSSSSSAQPRQTNTTQSRSSQSDNHSQNPSEQQTPEAAQASAPPQTSAGGRSSEAASGAAASTKSTEPSQAASAADREPTLAAGPTEGNDVRPTPEDQPDFGQGEKQHYNDEALEEHAAKSWLDSLPDSPVLLMKKKGNPKSSDQTW